jgi:hypothetical protein
MQNSSSKPSASELTEETSAFAVGAGILVMALFPLAIPIVALTAVALIPLLVVPLALGVLAAAVALPILGVRHLWRRLAHRPPRAQASFSHSGRVRSV